MGGRFFGSLRCGVVVETSVIWFAIPALAGGAYFTLALVAALQARRSPTSNFTPPVSILKPVRGRDPRFYEALVSHAAQNYPEFEIVLGVKDPADPALEDIDRLIAAYPNLAISVVREAPDTPNGKAGMLMALAAAARHPFLLVNDSDIVVEPGYLRIIMAGLEDPRTGLVTCLYRARGQSFPARFEALGIATEFMPSVLVARLIGVAEFALGSTMAFRAEHLQKIGGFAAIADYLADDYQLGARIHGLGLQIVFADTVVETNLGDGSWSDVWKHQVRWSRTIRVSRGSGYRGAIITHATFWCLVAALAGEGWIALGCLTMRMVAGLITARHVLKVDAPWWLMPVRDLWGFAVWCAGLFGSTVEWRHQKLKLRPDGRIERVE
jgi:ceramide glucosyltransferase